MTTDYGTDAHAALHFRPECSLLHYRGAKNLLYMFLPEPGNHDITLDTSLPFASVINMGLNNQNTKDISSGTTFSRNDTPEGRLRSRRKPQPGFSMIRLLPLRGVPCHCRIPGMISPLPQLL